MNSYIVYRASFYLMLVVANMALVGDSVDGQYAMLYTLAVAWREPLPSLRSISIDDGLCRAGWPTRLAWQRSAYCTSSTRTTRAR